MFTELRRDAGEAIQRRPKKHHAFSVRLKPVPTQGQCYKFSQTDLTSAAKLASIKFADKSHKNKQTNKDNER